MTAEWDDLARLAQAATPGPWDYDDSTIYAGDWESAIASYDFAGNPADAEFIAAANPATILRLIADLREWHRVAASNEAARNEARIERDRLRAALRSEERRVGEECR